MAQVNYFTQYTITTTNIIVDTLANGNRFIATITRGPNENQELKALAVRHKEQADAVLGMDSQQDINARLTRDIKTKASEVATTDSL